jgi:hypothetical protein
MSNASDTYVGTAIRTAKKEYLLAWKETPRSRITVTSSLNEISADQLGNWVVARGEAKE